MFTPPEWGGGAEEAVKNLKKAIELFAGDHPAAPEPSWGLAEAHAWLGQAYEKQGRKTEALASYRKALEVEPNFVWVSKVLIPGASK